MTRLSACRGAETRKASALPDRRENLAGHSALEEVGLRFVRPHDDLVEAALSAGVGVISQDAAIGGSPPIPLAANTR